MFIEFNGRIRMSELVRRRKVAVARLDARCRLVLRRFLRVLWTRLLTAGSSFTGVDHHRQYRSLESCGCFCFSFSTSSSRAVAVIENDCEDYCVDDVAYPVTVSAWSNGTVGGDEEFDDADVVPLKVSLLGDCQIGKTSFMVKYVGKDEQGGQSGLQLSGLNLMDKVLIVRGARITFTIWDVGGDHGSRDHVPIACRDSVAILIMFDLTSRCTLTNSISWYKRARKWNKTAIPILIGTKFDDFAQLPIEMQWTIVNQARTYAKAMHASLFFSSARQHINVNKIFKFIAARLFNLPWTVERNLTIGEPIIDF